jgi:hypothetical protein
MQLCKAFIEKDIHGCYKCRKENGDWRATWEKADDPCIDSLKTETLPHA